jgi:hypothetical protein
MQHSSSTWDASESDSASDKARLLVNSSIPPGRETRVHKSTRQTREKEKKKKVKKKMWEEEIW